MKNLENDIKEINKQIKKLMKKADALIKAAGTEQKETKVKGTTTRKRVKSVAAKTSKAKPSIRKKSRISSSTEFVLQVIKRHKKGIDVETLKKKTGFDDKKISNIVHRAYKKGLIKRSGRGIYKV